MKILRGERLGRTAAIVGLIIQPLIFYRRHLFQLTAHIPFDIADFHLPLVSFIEASVRRHDWPFWNPFEYCGVPIHADIQAQLFYPPTWVALLIDMFSGGTRLLYWLEWSTAAHMVIGGTGVYVLMRRLRCSRTTSFFGATVFQIGPFFVSQAQHLGAICAAAWFPIVLVCLFDLAGGFTARRMAQLSLSISMAFLCGFPAALNVIVVLAGLFCVGLIGSRFAKLRLLAFFSAGCALAAGIVAIQLVPTIALSRLSIASLRYKWLGDGGGLHWESLVSFVWPNYYHIFTAWNSSQYKLPYEFTFMYTFCGFMALAAIAVSPFLLGRTKFLRIALTLLLLSTVWMLGSHTPVYPVFFRLLPHFVQNALYAEYALLGFSLFAAITAALVLAHFEHRIPAQFLILIVLANSFNLIRTGANRVLNTFPGSYAPVMDSWSEAGRPVPETLQSATRTEMPPSRLELLSKVAVLEQGRPTLFDLFSASGDNPFLLLRYYHLRRLFSNDVEWSRRQFPRSLSWLASLNVGYVLDRGDAATDPLFVDAAQPFAFPSMRVYQMAKTLPRFYLQTRIVRVPNEDQGLTVAKDTSFDPEQKTIVEGVDNRWTPDNTASGEVHLLRYENNRIELDVQSSGRTFLVTSEAFYPGWTGTVNGRPAPILPTNVAFRGIPLEAGGSHVVMQYVPQHFVLSAALSLLAVIVTVCLLAV